MFISRDLNFQDLIHFEHVVIGGGIAGTSCITILANLGSQRPLLISPDKLKSLKLKESHTQLLKEYEVVHADRLENSSSFEYLSDEVKMIDSHFRGRLKVETG